MKKLLILFITGFISIIIYGQEKIKLVPYDKQEKIKINKLKSSSMNDNIGDLIYSKNEQNAVSIEVNPADIYKAQKVQLNIIKLYDKEGNILAKSTPIDLYDWIVKPLGDNNTVLVIFPAGTAQKAIIKILKRQGEQLKETEEIKQETAYFNIDISYDSKFFLCSFSPLENIREFPELVYYNSNGQKIWSFEIKDDVLYSTKILNKHIIASAKNPSQKNGKVYILSKKGELLNNKIIEDIMGNYEIEYSLDEDNEFFAISSTNSIYLFNSKTHTQIKSYKQIDKKSNLKSFTVDNKGNIIATTDKKLLIETIDNQHVEMELKMVGNPKISKSGNKIILEMWNPKESKYYEIQY